VLAAVRSALEAAGDARLALSPAFTDRLRSQLIRTLALMGELFRVADLLRRSGIESLTVKGPVLAYRAYADAAGRPYVDIDLLLRHADLPRAAGLLVEAGYESRIPLKAIRAGKTPGEYLFRRPGKQAVVELHTERTLRHFPRPLPIERFFERRTTVTLEGREVPALSAEDEFVLISMHGAKHFWERLMWVRDIAAVVDRHPQLEWSRIRRSAAEVGGERMVRLALLLAERALGVPVPAEMKADVAGDPACPPMVRKITAWLPYAGWAPPGLAERALFRLRAPGPFPAGVGYLARLSLSPTEEDWSSSAPAGRAVEILGRPVRLARKYRRTTERDPPARGPI
jgi:Uncharacterised nucleotidyltransferase